MSVKEAPRPRSWEGEFSFSDYDFPRLEERIAALKAEAKAALDETDSYREDSRGDLIGYFRRRMGDQVMEVVRRTSGEITDVVHLYEELHDSLRRGDTIIIQPLERTKEQQLQSRAALARAVDPENPDMWERVRKDTYLRDFSVEFAGRLPKRVPGEVVEDFLDASTSIHGRGGVVGLGQMESCLRDGHPIQIIPQPSGSK